MTTTNLGAALTKLSCWWFQEKWTWKSWWIVICFIHQFGQNSPCSLHIKIKFPFLTMVIWKTLSMKMLMTCSVSTMENIWRRMTMLRKMSRTEVELQRDLLIRQSKRCLKCSITTLTWMRFRVAVTRHTWVKSLVVVMTSLFLSKKPFRWSLIINGKLMPRASSFGNSSFMESS